jgi:hypothetical protein
MPGRFVTESMVLFNVLYLFEFWHAAFLITVGCMTGNMNKNKT